MVDDVTADLPPPDVLQTPAYVALLLAELAPERPTTIVDVGANPINEAPYSGLLHAGACHVIGFEPQAEAYAALQTSKTPAETYYPFAVGTGAAQTLRLYKNSGMTSVFDPYKPGLRMIGHQGWGKISGRVEFDTVALDQATDLPDFDLMKIDIQGAEVQVFQGAEKVMQSCIAVIVELRYLQIYKGEPMLGGVDTELRRQGFGLHKFMFNKSKMLIHSQAARVKTRRMLDQLLDGDAIYLRNIAEPDKLSVEQLKHMAVLAASVFDSHSLALYCLDALAARGTVAKDLASRYVDALPAHLRTEKRDQDDQSRA